MNCKICYDRGYYFDPNIPGIRLCNCVTEKCRCGGVSPYLDPDDYSKPCPCQQGRFNFLTVLDRFNKSYIPSKYRWMFEGSFKTSRNTRLQDLQALMYNLIHNFVYPISLASVKIITNIHTSKSKKPKRKKQKGLFIYGPPGSGKTLAATIILNELIMRYRIRGQFLKISRAFLNKIKASFNFNSNEFGTGYEFERSIQNLDCLVVDDFGVERDSQWEQETLYNLVDARYEEEKLTIFTSNKSVEEITHISDGRISSRIKEMCYIVSLEGVKDYREKFSK